MDSTAKKQKKNNLMLWLIVIIMVGSTIGFALLSANNTSNISQEQSTEELPPVQMKFSSKDVEGKIVTVFNTLYVFAYSDYDLEGSDKELYAIDGVKKVSSQWASLSQNGLGTPVYRAQVYFDSSTSLPELAEKIKKIGSFQGTYVLGTGIVELPQKITIFNSDLNLSKEHMLKDALVNAELSDVSQEGDLVKVDVYLTLSGSEEIRVDAIETENISAKPMPIKLEDEFAVSSLKPELILNSSLKASFLKGLDRNSLLEDINSTAGVSSTSLNLSEPDSSFSITLDGNYSQLTNDINSALYSVEGVTFISLFLDYNMLFVEYSADDFARLKASIEGKLASLNVGIASLDEPELKLDGTLMLESEDATSAADSIYNMLKEKGFSVQIKQPALIAAESLRGEDSNSQSVVQNGFFEALLKPIHKVGDIVSLEISYSKVRDKATSILAYEKINQ